MTFEEAFERIEKILEMMNSEKLALEESLKLFEEANKLVGICDQYLSNAQNKIETLIKNRGDVVLSEDGLPKKEAFEPLSIPSTSTTAM